MDRSTYDANEAMAQYAERLKSKRDHLQKLRDERRKRAQVSMRWMLLRAAVYVTVAVATAAAMIGMFMAGVFIR